MVVSASWVSPATEGANCFAVLVIVSASKLMAKSDAITVKDPCLLIKSEVAFNHNELSYLLIFSL